MSTLSESERLDFISQIATYRFLINEEATKTTDDELAKFENLLTLTALEACLNSFTGSALASGLGEFFRKRWDRIRNSKMDYTQSPFNPVNQFCLDLAKKLSPVPDDELNFGGAHVLTGPYFLLMPSLIASENVYGKNIHDFALHQIVLSDDERLFIPIVECLRLASTSDDGELQHVVADTDGQCFALSPTEKDRLVNHSTEAASYFQAITAYNAHRVHGDNLGAHLQRLSTSLREGGARLRGTELDSGAAANIAIAEFYEYWQTYSKQRQDVLFKKHVGLKDIIDSLMRAVGTQYRDVTYCVQIIANKIDVITSTLDKTTLNQLKANLTITQATFEQAIKTASYKMRPSIAKNPAILATIHQLPSADQAVIFRREQHKNAWHYALEFTPEDLTSFLPLLDVNAKRAVSGLRFSHGKTPLMIAATSGEADSVSLLLQLGVSIDVKDFSLNTALILAAKRGHVAAVRCLLDRNASIDVINREGNTALYEALINGHHGVAAELITRGASLTIRNRDGKAALELASSQPELLKLILRRAATLRVAQQGILASHPNGLSYKNVLDYAAECAPHLFNELLTIVLANNDREILTPTYSVTLLMMTAMFGNREMLCRVVDQLQIYIEQRDRDHNTALSLAARVGNRDTVIALLGKDAYLETTNNRANTPLHEAIISGHRSTVEALLIRDANMLYRNADGKNALDLLLEHHPLLLDTLLVKALTLDAIEQKDLLSRAAPGIIYTNVLTYARVECPYLLDKLYDTFPEAKRNPAKAFLSGLDFDKHFRCINSKYQQLKRAAQRDPARYNDAARTAKTLVIHLAEEAAKLVMSDDTIDSKKIEFQRACRGHINDAKGVLNTHRGWKPVLSALFLILAFPISVPLCAFGIFSLRTDSGQKLHNFERALNSKSMALG